MQLGSFSGGVYALTNWFARLAYINILWILFSLLGLGVFGLFPATIAMLATIRQLLKKNDPKIFKTFWHYYKKEFIVSNKLGAIIVSVGLIFFLNLRFLQSMSGKLSELLYYPTIVLACFFILATCYILASYVEFDQKLPVLIKNSLLIMIHNPLPSLYIVFGIGAVYYLIHFIPGTIFFFSGSLLGLVILSSATLAYRKIIRKQTEFKTNTE